MNYLCLVYLEQDKLHAVPDRAIQVAAGIPAACEGSVEIRPVRQLNP
jgi:hypothetical protein